jgi:hypothetical protein
MSAKSFVGQVNAWAAVRDDNRALALVGSTGEAPDRVAVTAAVPRVAPDRRAI